MITSQNYVFHDTICLFSIYYRNTKDIKIDLSTPDTLTRSSSSECSRFLLVFLFIDFQDTILTLILMDVIWQWFTFRLWKEECHDTSCHGRDSEDYRGENQRRTIL